MHYHSIDRLSELNPDDTMDDCEPMSHIYLKHGLTVKVSAPSTEAFLVANADILEPRHIKTRGPRRQRE